MWLYLKHLVILYIIITLEVCRGIRTGSIIILSNIVNYMNSTLNQLEAQKYAIMKKKYRIITSAESISFVFWEGGAKTFLIKASATWNQLMIQGNFMFVSIKDSSSLLNPGAHKNSRNQHHSGKISNMNGKYIWRKKDKVCNMWQTSFGEPSSWMSPLLVGKTFTLTFSNGSITSLNTLSCPSITISWIKYIKRIRKIKQIW